MTARTWPRPAGWLLLALLVVVSGCGLVFPRRPFPRVKPPAPAIPANTLAQPAEPSPGAGGSGSTGSTLPPGSPGSAGTPDSPGGAGGGDPTAPTAPVETTTPTDPGPGYGQKYSVDDLARLAGQERDPLCRSADQTVLRATTLANFASGTNTRPSVLTPEQRAAAYSSLLEFRTDVGTLVGKLAALGLLPKDGSVQAAIQAFDRMANTVTPQDDARLAFIGYIQTQGASLWGALSQAVVPRCPASVLAKIDPRHSASVGPRPAG